MTDFNLFAFIINSILFGIGLAMDAFSVSVANGLNEPDMKRSKMFGVAGMFSFFQFVMPMLGWFCVSTIAHIFTAFQKFIPWIALILLLYIGGQMIFESLKNKDDEVEKSAVGFIGLVVQGIATSIDALSVGFTISTYNLAMAAGESLIIGLVTFGICMAGLKLGRKFGTKLAGKAGILGGVILICIGLEIFISSFFK